MKSRPILNRVPNPTLYYDKNGLIFRSTKDPNNWEYLLNPNEGVWYHINWLPEAIKFKSKLLTRSELILKHPNA
jgi:hypothetical protein